MLPRSVYNQRGFIVIWLWSTTSKKQKASSYEEAVDQQVWKDVIMEECASILKNDVWEVVPRLGGKLVVTFRWLYMIKYPVNDIIKKYKAQFVERGFS